MATYWAELDATNIVVQVITGVDDLTIDGIPTAQWYTNFVGAPCVQTFIDNPDKIYAGVGFTYDPATQNFIRPQPFPSWTLNSNNIWQPPTPKPDGEYYWNEDQLGWSMIP